jgi:hypothetical protein
LPKVGQQVFVVFGYLSYSIILRDGVSILIGDSPVFTVGCLFCVNLYFFLLSSFVTTAKPVDRFKKDELKNFLNGKISDEQLDDFDDELEEESN